MSIMLMAFFDDLYYFESFRNDLIKFPEKEVIKYFQS